MVIDCDRAACVFCLSDEDEDPSCRRKTITLDRNGFCRSFRVER